MLVLSAMAACLGMLVSGGLVLISDWQTGVRSAQTQAIAMARSTAVGFANDVRALGTESWIREDAAHVQRMAVEISAVSGQDVDIVGSDRTILTDEDTASVGSFFRGDVKGEVQRTLKDGVPRTFIEVSRDHPK